MEPYAFTDPLGQGEPCVTRRRIRRAHGLVYGAAAPSLLLALLTDGGPLSQRLAAGSAMVVVALLAGLLLAWRGAPDGLLLSAFPLAALTVTVIAVLDPPLALTPMYYVWPLMTAAYFLRAREAAATYAVTCASFGAVCLLVLAGPRLMMWLTVVIVGAVVVAFVWKLKTGLEDLVARLGALARDDGLTGALNRRALLERVDEELARVRRLGGSCAVAVVDVDCFKRINDRHGHAAGDAALRYLVHAIAGRLRETDAVGRLGGDEFAVLLAGADAEDALAYAEELRELVARRSAAAGLAITVSAGVAALPWDGATSGELLAAADEALYRAKRAGRDTVRAARDGAGSPVRV